MTDGIFRRTDILLPKGCELSRWSVVACDQFTSNPGYWREVEAYVGDAPSSLRLILPEAYLGQCSVEEAERNIHRTMDGYLSSGLFETLSDSYVYIERSLSDGTVRCGLVGALDLEAYDWRAGSTSPVRATEGTVADRLPPRVKLRREASLEMPHIMVFLDDPGNSVIVKPAGAEKLYDFTLMQGGGQLCGYRVHGEDADRIDKALQKLADPGVIAEKYGENVSSPVLYAIGDGNHSLAAAKQHWETVKSTLSPRECETHPARFALVELVNIHDPAIRFEPIHRVAFDTDTADFAEYIKARLSSGEGHTLELVCGGLREKLRVAGYSIGSLIGECERLCREYVSLHGGRIDYIHGDDEARTLASGLNACGILLPAMQKSELFPSVMQSGAFPKKSFSIGHAPDKRYYLECRKIR